MGSRVAQCHGVGCSVMAAAKDVPACEIGPAPSKPV